jgi:hypothetical protein
VLACVGASLVRDAIDRRVVEETRTGTVTYSGSLTGRAGIIDSQSDVGGWPVYSSAAAPPDANGDGIPDGWLESRYPGKTAASVNAEGYTCLEVYLNSLVEDITAAQYADGSETSLGGAADGAAAVGLRVDAAGRRVEISAAEVVDRVEIYSVAGMSVARTPCGTAGCSVRLEGLASGIYVARIFLANRPLPYHVKFML